MVETTRSHEHGLIVDAASARAIRDGWKTVTRRIVRDGTLGRRCRYGAAGDLMWVREPFQIVRQEPEAARRGEPLASRDIVGCAPLTRLRNCRVVYLADCLRGGGAPSLWYRPSVHMPRWASRLLLRITEVAPERLNLITDAGARLEGYVGWPAASPRDAAADTARGAFAKSWDHRYRHARADQWSANPWVWVIRFRCTNECAS